MSSHGSDSKSLREDRTQITSVALQLLGSISDIMAKLANIYIENQYFIEIGSYFYRVSTVVMELHTTESYSTNAMDIFLSLQKNISFAEELISVFQNSTKQVVYLELRSNLEQFEKVVKSIGENLSSMLLSTYESQEYVDIAVHALSMEMKSFHFEGAHSQHSNDEEIKNKKLPLLETDLYSISAEIPLENSWSSEIINPYKIEQFGSRNSRTRQSHESDSSNLSQYSEPLYDTFICSLTNMIMEDPVTIESGVTFEKVAIAEWYKRFKNPNDIVCPKTGIKIVNTVLNTNRALKATIQEWRERNELQRIKNAMSTLSQAGTDNMIFEALENLVSICFGKNSNKEKVLSMGILPLLVMFLGYKDRRVRCASLELLLQLVENEDDVKEMVATTVTMTVIIKMLSSNHPPIKHTTLLLLRELSKLKPICQIIGSTNGAILMLVTIKYKHSSDAFASEKAEEILENLECFTDNIKSMADNGYLEPLLNHLVTGTEEIQTEIASYLGEVVLGHDSKILVAERASPALIKMLQTRNSFTRKSAFRALKQISSYHPNIELLIQAGIINTMVEEIFTQAIHSGSITSKNEAAIILANIFESGIQLESLEGPTLNLNKIAYKIICSLNNSTPVELNISLTRVLVCLTKTPQLSAKIVSVIKENEASLNLIELINNPYEELQIAGIKLLISLTPYMGHTIADRLCRTRVQLETLIEILNDKGRISEKHAVSVNFLAKLPHQNLTLNLALVNTNIVPSVLQALYLVQKSATRTSRYTVAYSEGLMGILVRFTKTLYDNQVLFMARNYNFTNLFTELLTTTLSHEVQRLSAVGLENLSLQSVSLSKLPPAKKNNIIFFFFPTCGSFSSSKYKKIMLCPVHRGICSSQDTFCLFEANAVEKLLSCLDHEDIGVIEAALSALCTLLDENVDAENSINILSEMKMIQHVSNVVREHKEEALCRKSFWLIERFLMKGGERSISDISQDRLLPSALVNAFHHGDGNTRQMAENILMSLNKMSSFTTNYTN